MKNTLIIALCVVVLAQSCVSKPTGNNNIQIAVFSPSPTVSETPVTTTEQPATPNVIDTCIELTKKDTVEGVSGFLVLDSYLNQSYSLMKLEDGSIEPIQTRFPLISPKKDYLINEVCAEKCQYVLQTSQKIINTIPVQEDWLLRKWLDNEHIIISSFSRPQDFLVMNPFTGETQKRSLNLENPFSIYHTNKESVVPFDLDPSLTMALFFDEKDGGRLVLWDIKNGKELASLLHLVNSAVGLEYPYSWSLDGKSYLITAPKNSSSNALYKLNINGVIVRLTFYDQQYNFGNVANPAWSPDSSHIAFWLRLSEEKVVNIEEIPQYLAVMNVQTREVKVYCQTAGSTPGDFISWSSDGNQLIVNTRTLQDTAEPLLIDLIHLTKTILPTRNSFVEGWLTP